MRARENRMGEDVEMIPTRTMYLYLMPPMDFPYFDCLSDFDILAPILRHREEFSYLHLWSQREGLESCWIVWLRCRTLSCILHSDCPRSQYCNNHCWVLFPQPKFARGTSAPFDQVTSHGLSPIPPIPMTVIIP